MQRITGGRAASLGTVAAVAFALAATGCGSSSKSNSTSSGTSSGGSGPKIALLLPESKTTRYESQDKPHFEADLKALCPNCSIIYSNADQDASKQQQQAEAALTQGAKVLVLDSVDSASAAVIANQARAQGVKVLAYDRIVSNAPINYYVSFDNQRVGVLQGTSLVAKLKADGKTSGNLVMINGSPTDNNAKLFKLGAHSVLDKSGFKIAKEYDTPDWSPDQAQTEMQQAITAVGKNGYIGVYAANDGTAGGAVAAQTAAGVDPKTRPLTGQDAELAGIQRIIAGSQYMTVYKAVKQEAQVAAQLAYDLATGKQPAASLINAHQNNGKISVPSVLLTPVAVTKANIKGTVVKDGYWSVAQICTGQYASACTAAGLQ
jgi:D-xylose transport system substrate-binding protein